RTSTWRSSSSTTGERVPAGLGAAGGDARACRRAPHPERMRGPPHTEPGSETSALVRRGVLLLGVMLELLALLLETVHQIRQTGTNDRAPVITVRVGVRTVHLPGVHHSAHVSDDLPALLTRLGPRGRDLAILIRIHTLESHDLPLSPHPGPAQMKIEETQEPTIRTTTRRAASSRSACPARRTHHTSASPAARAPASPR